MPIEKNKYPESKDGLHTRSDMRCLLFQSHFQVLYRQKIVLMKNLLKDSIEGRIKGKKPRGRSCIGMLEPVVDDPYRHLKNGMKRGV